MVDLPDGVVTFLLTDVQGSTALWEASPDSMMHALNQHDAVIETATEAHGGVLVKPRGEGDSRFVVFPSATEAVGAVADMQRGLADIHWTTPKPLLVRMALHTGSAELQLGDYYGSAVNRAARLRTIAHGGQTLMSASTMELVQDQLPPDVAIQDMGEHGLKDLTRPERVYQIDIVGLPDTFPPLASLDAVPNNLPVQLTEFVGRRAELADIKRVIAETRLLTILAPGGAGKTRLAIQAAAEMTDDFPNGVFFVDLAPITSPDDIVQTVAESLGVSLSTDEDLQVQLLAYLGNKRQLLVFDNFEHLDGGAAIVSTILKTASHVKVIATSRSKLNVDGETVMSLSGLDTGWETSEDAFQASSVHLFIDGAKRTDASFSLSVDDLAPLGRILRLVDGMPLGILLAAAWVDMLPIREIDEEIARSFDFLETDAGGVPDRHRSIRAVFDYSWTMLSEEERRMFTALSVFRGGFTREAAQHVAGASIRNLANLANKALLVHDRDSARYSIHELLRQYAEDALKEDPARWVATIGGHTEFFADLAAHAEQLIPSSDQKHALAIMENDLDNIRAAWRQTLATGDATSARKIIIGLWLPHEMRGWYRAGESVFGEALEAFEIDSEDESTQIVRATAAAAQAKFMSVLGRIEEGTEQATFAAERLAPLSDQWAYLRALECQCECLTNAGQVRELATVSTEAIRVAKGIGDEWWAHGMQNYQALAEMQSGNLEAAATILEEDDDASIPTDYVMGTWRLMIRAMISVAQNQPEAAVELHSRAIELSREVGNRQALIVGLEGLGEANAAAGNPGAADVAFIESLAMTTDMGLLRDMARTMTRVAEVRAALGMQEQAVDILACVIADPLSSQVTAGWGTTPVSEKASEVLSGLAETLDAEEFAAARARGTAKSLEVRAKELLVS